MADSQQYQYLLGTLDQKSGHKAWLDFKLKAKWIDLSTADFMNRPLINYDLSEANLSTAIFLDSDLSGSDLSDAQLAYSDLRRANLRGAILDRADLNSANLQGANLADACLEEAKMRRAKLAGANLAGADLSGADLSEADLRGASLKYARLSGAKLAGVDVAGADLTGAVFDDDAPMQMLNFSQSVVDDRKYREMRCHLSLKGDDPTDLAGKEGRDGKKEPTAPSAKPGSRRHGSGSKEKPAEKPGASHKKGKAKHPLEQGPNPIMKGKPDLATAEGCSQVLEVPLGAPLDQIVKSFRTKAKIYHPDMVQHLNQHLQDLAAEEFRRLRQAYETLTRHHARPLTGIQWPAGIRRYASPYDYSVEEYETLVRFNPANTNILYNMAWKYFEEGQYAEAVAGYQQVLSLDPNDEDAQFNLMIVRLYSEIVLPSLGPDAGT